MITSIADAPAIMDAEEPSTAMWDDSYVPLAAKRALGALRSHFEGIMRLPAPTGSHSFLQDACENLVDKVLPHIHNKDGKLGSNPTDVRRRVLKGLWLMARRQSGMRLDGQIHSFTGEYTVWIVEGGRTRCGRTPVDNRYNAAKQRKQAKQAKSLRKQANARERKCAVAA